jgi:hypothetical protein
MGPKVPRSTVLSAEEEILSELTIQPRVILVETHEVYGAPTGLGAAISFLIEVKRNLATTAKNTTSKCFSESTPFGNVDCGVFR